MKWLTAALLMSALYADPVQQEESNAPVHRLQLGPDLFWSHCRTGFDRDNEGIKLTASINGYYAGLRAGYDYLQPDALYAGTEAIVAWGRENLRKHNSTSPLFPTCTNCASTHEHHTRLWANAEQRLGYNSQSTLFPHFIVTPYLGIGWHYEGSSSDHAHWYYGAIGLKTIQQFYEKFEIGFEFKGLLAFDVHEKGFISITTTQGKKTFWGFEAAVPLRWLIGNSGKWDFEFKPYFLKLNLNSPQTIVGARLMLGYSF